MAMADRNLQYHNYTFDLLGTTPVVSKPAAVALWQREEALDVTFPPAVREWYSLAGAVEFLAKYSNHDHPVPLEKLGKTNIYNDEPDPYNPLERGLLHIMTENQGMCYWALYLDGSEDPPVYVHADGELGWQLHAEGFSIFTYAQAWDWSQNVALEAQDRALTEQDFAFLQSTFRQGPFTYAWPSPATYRFFDETSRLVIRDDPEVQADWYASALSEEALLRLAARIWHCGILSVSLYDVNEQGAAVLKKLRPDGSGT